MTMKDTKDTSTLELLPLKRPRGRPRTGTALSGAARQARYREQQRLESVTVTFNRTDLQALKLLIQVADFRLVDVDQETQARLLDAVIEAGMKG